MVLILLLLLAIVIDIVVVITTTITIIVIVIVITIIIIIVIIIIIISIMMMTIKSQHVRFLGDTSVTLGSPHPTSRDPQAWNPYNHSAVARTTTRQGCQQEPD